MGNCNNCNYRGEEVSKDEVITTQHKDYDSSAYNKKFTIRAAKGGLKNDNAVSSRDISIHVEEEVNAKKSDNDNYENHNTRNITLNNENNLVNNNNNNIINEEENNNNTPIYHEVKKEELKETVLKHGLISDHQTMNAKTSSIILEVEERENLAKFIEELKNKNSKEDLLDLGEVIQFYNGSFYEGTWNYDLRKHGFGTLLMVDGTKYAGFFNNDVFEGNGYFIDPHGRLYIGEFINGKANGKGRITTEKDPGYLYEGEFEDNLYHGEGEERFSNGNVYKGQFVRGYKEPYGRLTFPDGSEYEGNFSKNIIEGKGRFKWKDGRTYSGDFHDSKLHGKGRTTWVDGSYYEGEYKNDNFNGYGESRDKNGAVYKGQWMNNNYHGVGYYKDDVSEYRGIWRFNKNIKKF